MTKPGRAKQTTQEVFVVRSRNGVIIPWTAMVLEHLAWDQYLQDLCLPVEDKAIMIDYCKEQGYEVLPATIISKEHTNDPDQK